MTSMLERARYQLGYLGDPRLGAIVSLLPGTLASTLAPLVEGGILALGVAGAIELDLLYILTRHRAWLAAPLMVTVVADHLATRFALPQELAYALARGSVAAARQLAQPEASSSEDFLKYICVQTAAAANEERLALDLGFGVNLLMRIKDALGLFTPESSTSIRYLPELDAQIARAVAAIAADLQKSPWALQKLRLTYLLADCAHPWRQIFSETGTDWVFDLLLTAVHRQRMQGRDIAREVAKLVPQMSTCHSDAMIMMLCGILAERGLMGNDGPRSFRPLPLASELTAQAFAAAHPMDFAKMRTSLYMHDSHVQAALILGQQLNAEELTELVTKVRPMSPLALRAAVSRLAATRGQEETATLLQTTGARERSHCLRETMADLLAGPLSLNGHKAAVVADSGCDYRTSKTERTTAEPGACR